MAPTYQEQRNKYKRDGYLIIDPGVPEDVLDGIIADLDGKYEPGWEGDGVDVPFRNHKRVQDAWRISANVKTLALAPRVLQLLSECYRRKPLPFQTLNFRIGTEQPVHSDTIHFNSRPSGYMCGLWVALEDMDMDNGPLVYYPGSHKLPEITMAGVDKAGCIRHSYYERFLSVWQELRGNAPDEVAPVEASVVYPRYETFIADMIVRLKMQPHYATLKKGQALLWSANLLHGGCPRKDKSRTRLSQVTHYYFEGCQYYTPLLSQGKKMHLRDPVWIV